MSEQNGFKNKVGRVWAFIKHVAATVWTYLKAAKMEWIIMVSLFAIDLISKAIVEATMDIGQSVPIIPYVFNAHKTHNYAAVFGSDFLKSWLGDIGARIFFCVFAVAASVAFILVLIKNKGKNRMFRIAIAMFVAGAMGNCIDRMFLGYVRDFVEFVYFGLTIGGRTSWQYIFNLADAFLICGVILIIIYLIFIYKDNSKKSDEPVPLTTELAETEPVDITATGIVMTADQQAVAARDVLGDKAEAAASNESEDSPPTDTDAVPPTDTDLKTEKENGGQPRNANKKRKAVKGDNADDSSDTEEGAR